MRLYFAGIISSGTLKTQPTTEDLAVAGTGWIIFAKSYSVAGVADAVAAKEEDFDHGAIDRRIME